jgi:hypothetical protein
LEHDYTILQLPWSLLINSFPQFILCAADRGCADGLTPWEKFHPQETLCKPEGCCYNFFSSVRIVLNFSVGKTELYFHVMEFTSDSGAT